MNLTTYKTLLTRFLAATEKDVLDAFGALKGAVRTKDYVYIEGRRKDRILLVAHADTAGPTTEPVWHGDAATTYLWGLGWQSGRDRVVLGADDRAGCALMYNVFDGQHSVLITTGEERGCVGAKIALKEIGDKLEQHHFAIQVDRRGDRQAVFYNCGTKVFQEWVMKSLQDMDYAKLPWSNEPGSWTDIAEMCPHLGICGVNLSAGYRNEHSEDEILLLGAWLHTRTVLRRIIQQPQLPQFLMQKAKRYEGHPTYGASVGSERSTTVAPYTTVTKASMAKDGLIEKIGTETFITFANVKIRVSDISKKQRKFLIKGFRRRWREGQLTTDQCIAYCMALIGKDESVRDILDLPVKPITEKDRAEHWTGETWERQPVKTAHWDKVAGIPDPNDKVRPGDLKESVVTGKSGGRIVTVRLLYCKHYVYEGKYCSQCKGTVGSSAPTVDPMQNKCDHGVSLRLHCAACQEIGHIKMTKEVKPQVCRHGVQLAINCTDCEIEDAVRDGTVLPADGEALATELKDTTCVHHIPVHLHCVKCHAPSTEIVIEKDIAGEYISEIVEAHTITPMPLLPPVRRSLPRRDHGVSGLSIHRDKVSEGFRVAGDGESA